MARIAMDERADNDALILLRNLSRSLDVFQDQKVNQTIDFIPDLLTEFLPKGCSFLLRLLLYFLVGVAEITVVNSRRTREVVRLIIAEVHLEVPGSGKAHQLATDLFEQVEDSLAEVRRFDVRAGNVKDPFVGRDGDDSLDEGSAIQPMSWETLCPSPWTTQTDFGEPALVLPGVDRPRVPVERSGQCADGEELHRLTADDVLTRMRVPCTGLAALWCVGFGMDNARSRSRDKVFTHLPGWRSQRDQLFYLAADQRSLHRLELVT